MLKKRLWIKISLIAASAALLFACSNSNSGVSPYDNGHSNYAGSFAAAAVHGPLAKTALGDCQPCHAVPNYGSNPRFNVLHTNIPRGCETCHKALTAHPTPWLLERTDNQLLVPNTTTHATVGSATSTCELCHGKQLDGVGGTAPSCMSPDPLSGVSCHASSPVQKPTGCTSCHAASPSGPDGNTSPNRNFGHNKHAVGLNLACAVCHGSSTFGKATHADLNANVLLSSTHQAKSFASFSYNKGSHTCSGVICHGGQTTPDWRTSITACTQCHESGTALGTPQYNSYYSGKHASHLTGVANNIYTSNPANSNIACTDCHKMDKPGSLHFAGLATQEMDPPGDTVGGNSTKVTNYNNSLKTCSTSSCHTGGDAGKTWQ